LQLSNIFTEGQGYRFLRCDAM